MRFLYYFVLLTLLYSQASSAKKYILYKNNGQPTHTYLNLLRDYIECGKGCGLFEPGDILVLDRNHRVIFQDYLNHGNTTQIMKVSNPTTNEVMALRLPIVDKFKKIHIGQYFIMKTLEGEELLREYNVPISKTIDSSVASYILQELVDGNYTALDYIEKIYPKMPEKFEQLKVFFYQIAPFQEIGDFALEQVIYSESQKKWVLVDWASIHLLLGEEESGWGIKGYLEKIIESHPDVSQLLKVYLNRQQELSERSGFNRCQKLFHLMMESLTKN